MTRFRFVSFTSSKVVPKVFRRATFAEPLLFSFLITTLLPAIFLLSGPGHERDVLGAAAPPGERIFRSKCAVCHGVDGSGRTPNGKKLKVPDLRSDRVQNHDDEEWLDVITNGKGEMPPFGKKYSQDKLQQVISFVRSLGRKN